jgi:hypothetical protein
MDGPAAFAIGAKMSASLNGKRVVVLGGTSGIGLATAKAAQREGAMIDFGHTSVFSRWCRGFTTITSATIS